MTDALLHEPPKPEGVNIHRRSPNKRYFNIPPSTELFPDSYEHAVDKAAIYICILSPSPSGYMMESESDIAFNENADALTKALEDCGYDSNKLKRLRFSVKGDLDDFLRGVKTMDFFDSSAVLLFWFGETDKDGSNGMISLKNSIYDIRDLWKPFVAVETLRGKPKLNMFFTYLPPPSDLQVDSCNRIKKSSDPYEPPAEADVLIIYQKTDLRKHSGNSSYVKSLASNMKDFGRQYHMANLACINANVDPKLGQHYPIVVSTLTRKFYIQSNNHRGIFLELDELTKAIQDNLNNMLKQGRKKTSGPRRSANIAPGTSRRHSKENISTDKILPQLAPPMRQATGTSPTPSQPKPRLLSQSKQTEQPKQKWKF